MSDKLRWRWECPSCLMLHSLELSNCTRCGYLNPAREGKDSTFRKTIQLPGTDFNEIWRCNACKIVNSPNKQPRCQWCWTIRPIFKELVFISSTLTDFGSSKSHKKSKIQSFNQHIQTDDVLISDSPVKNTGISVPSDEISNSSNEIGRNDAKVSETSTSNLHSQGNSKHFPETESESDLAPDTIFEESMNNTNVLEQQCTSEGSSQLLSNIVNVESIPELDPISVSQLPVLSEVTQTKSQVDNESSGLISDPENADDNKNISIQETLVNENKVLGKPEATDFQEDNESIVVSDAVDQEIVETQNDTQIQQQSPPVVHQQGGLIITEIEDQNSFPTPNGVSEHIPQTPAFPSNQFEVNQISQECMNNTMDNNNQPRVCDENLVEMNEELAVYVPQNPFGQISIPNNSFVGQSASVTPSQSFGNFFQNANLQSQQSIPQFQTQTQQFLPPQFQSNPQAVTQNFGPFGPNNSFGSSGSPQQYTGFQMQTQPSSQPSSSSLMMQQSGFQSLGFQNPNNQSGERMMAVGNNNHFIVNVAPGANAPNTSRYGLFGNNNTVTINHSPAPPPIVAPISSSTNVFSVPSAPYMQGRRIRYATRRLRR